MPEENLPMVAVFYHAIPVANPQTGYPLLEARGAIGNIVALGGTTPLRLSQDEAGTIPIPQPITITPGGYIPAHWNQDGLEDAVFVPLSGTWSTPISSNQGLRDAARAAASDAAEARAAAELARAEAEQAASGVTAPSDETVATLIGSPGSQSREAVAALINETPTGVSSFGDLQDVPTAFPTTGDLIEETSTRKVMTDVERSKLAGVEVAATKNRADAQTDQLLAARVTVVEHGTVATVARPAGVKSVQWVGTVRPNNMTDADTWVGPEGATAAPTSAAASTVTIKATAMNTWPTTAQIDAQILAEGGPNFAGLLVFDSTPFPGCSAPPLRTGAHWLKRTAA